MNQAAKTMAPKPRRRPLRAALSLLAIALVLAWGVSLVYSVRYYRTVMEEAKTDGHSQEWRHSFAGVERGCAVWGAGDKAAPSGVSVGLPAGGIVWLPSFW